MKIKELKVGKTYRSIEYPLTLFKIDEDGFLMYWDSYLKNWQYEDIPYNVVLQMEFVEKKSNIAT